MSKVDWDTAPKDAQFYSIGRFRKHEDDKEFRLDGSIWLRGIFDPLEWHKKRDDFERSPNTPWVDEHIPPVGIECESYDADGWQRCKIPAVDARGNLVVDLLLDGVVAANHEDYCHSFRPISKNREQWVSKALIAVEKSYGKLVDTASPADILNVVYDAMRAGKLKKP